MAKTAPSTPNFSIDLSEPWEVPARLLDALASFDQIVARIDGAVLGRDAHPTVDLRHAA